MKSNANNTIRTTSLLLSGLVGLLSVSAATAHDIWLTVDSQHGVTNAQINFGDTDKRDTPDRERVITLQLLTPTDAVELRKPLTPGTRFGHPVLETKSFSASTGSLLFISYDNGFWIDSPKDKTEINTTTMVVPGGTAQHWTAKYGKTLLGPGAYKRVLHARLEVVPLADPFKLAIGQRLPVRLVLNGKPVANAKIAYGDGVTPIPDAQTPYVTTDSKGVAAIPLSRKGAYLLTTDCNAPTLFPKQLSKYDHLYSSLAFDTAR